MLASSCVIIGVRKQSGAATVDDFGSYTDSDVQAMLSLTPQVWLQLELIPQESKSVQ